MSNVASKNVVEQEELAKEVLTKAYKIMSQAVAMTDLYEEEKDITYKYVHATSRGHEAIQIATGLQLLKQDWAAPYYRDDAFMMSIGMRPYDMMLQLLAKRNDPFSGGRSYYCHVSLCDEDKPKIPHQSSATGMQAIPTTGVAMGVQYKETLNIAEDFGEDKPVVICSIGDAATTEGEYSEALQMAALKQLPIIYLVQDNEWDISATAEEIRAQNAAEFAKGFHGIEIRSIDGSDFAESYNTMEEVIGIVRKERRPFVVHAKVPLLSHHTSGVRKDWYRHDLEEHATRDPYPKLEKLLLENGFTQKEIDKIKTEAVETVAADFKNAVEQEDPKPEDLLNHYWAPTEVTEEKGTREPAGKDKTVMVDSALFAIQELMRKHPEALLYGQDVGGRLGGVFREAATLAQKFGKDRVFNTPIQEAFIIGSSLGMANVGLKPIVEVQFADYLWPGLNQLFTELSRSYYLSNGKWPASSIIRVPIGAYGSGGPYHSSSVDSVVANIRGIKVAYPSTGADLKGLMKSAFYDPNCTVMLEHKGLYWSKIKGTEGARTIEPDEDYIIPFGKGRIVLAPDAEKVKSGESMCVITYGMGVYWSTKAAKQFKGQVEVIDLRTLLPWDKELVFETVKKHGRCMVITEEPDGPTFGRAIAGKIQEDCFEYLDAPVRYLCSIDVPAIPLNSTLEQTMIPNAEKTAVVMKELLEY